VKIIRKKLAQKEDIGLRHAIEAAVLYQLQNASHIVKLRGWCNTTIVVDYIPKQLSDLVFEKRNELSVQRALELALDAAIGVQQLHAVKGGPVAHTDIQTRQYLIDFNGRLLLNDFNRVKYAGLSHNSQSSHYCYFNTGVAKGKWRSPEEYLNSDLHEKVDIYSLANVLWTLRSREEPFATLPKHLIYVKLPQDHITPNVSKMLDYPLEMQRLIQQCWDHDPNKRPSSIEVVERIRAILQAFLKAP